MSGAASLMNQTKMDSDGKLVLIDAVISNNESEVKRLIDAGVDVNETDDQGKTALFYAAANKSIRDASILAALVEKGNAVVNGSDNCGRTPLFYAITTSIVSTHYLLDHDANLEAKDYCHVSILTFVIEDYLMKQESPSNPAPLSEVFDLLIEKGLQRDNIVQSIINLVFCKIPLLFTAKERETIEGFPTITQDQVVKALEEARQYLDEGNEGKAQSIMTIENKIKRGEIFDALQMLSKLRADPNSADSVGNTVLHYATLLPMMGVPQETVMKICDCLMRRGLQFNTKNHQSQTPLLFFLSENHWKFLNTSKRPGVKSLVEVCKFLLKNRSQMSATSQSGETVFHLLMKLFQRVLQLHDEDLLRKVILNEMIEILELFSSSFALKGEEKVKIVNKSDGDQNTPLHLWASLALSSPQDYKNNIGEGYTFEKLLEIILKSLRKCGAQVNVRNTNEETPLHVCKTWAAVKLLIDAGGNTKDVDSSGRSPLLVVANSKAFLKHPDLFYPDVTEDTETFWKNAIKMELYPWTADKHGETVLKILIESDASVLAEALVKAACEDANNDSILVCILNSICEDESEHHWKTVLVEEILKTRKIQTGSEEALCICCRIIMKDSVSTCDRKESNEEPSEQQTRSRDEKNAISENEAYLSKIKDEMWKENDTKSSVHYRIAKRLRAYSSDSFRIPDSLGISCLDMADYPELEDILTIKWNPVSEKYKKKLREVSWRQESEQVEMIWYHKNPIAKGRFGVIFAGINEKDGREVAVKRIKHQGTDENEIEEMKTLIYLADCEQVVRYVLFYENKDFLHVILELMEGNLDEYLEEKLDATKSVQLCKDIVMGLNYLHEKNIIHRDLKPKNILYKTYPKLCLKIADFGLSRIDNIHSGCKDNVGTRCWVAPEVFRGGNHSKSSDTFSCGLILHYILSVRKHPFSPADCGAKKSKSKVAHKTNDNILKGKMEGWDNSLCPEATHLVEQMLKQDSDLRPTAGQTLDHPLFWSKDKKINFLKAVGNQTEFQCPCKEREPPLTAVEEDLNNNFKMAVRRGSWTDSEYLEMQDIYKEMTSSEKGRKSYDTSSVIELVRFIRNAYAHVSGNKQQTKIRKLLLEDFVFLEYFPALMMEVYKAVTTHEWDKTRDEIKKQFMSEVHDHKRHLLPQVPESGTAPNTARTLWIQVCQKFEHQLLKVATSSEQECEMVKQFRYHQDPIASGQFGNIYAGINVKDGREVAIKKIEKARMPMHRRQDKREISNLTALADCQQVVRYICFLEDHDPDFSYVVLELMEGNLVEYLSNPFDKDKSIQLCCDVVMGIKYLHEQKIIHRDLKPTNILYKLHPKLCLKLADFGLSRHIDGTGSSTVYSINSAGTKCWIAPEVLNSDPPEHSESSDMFSCGLVLHYILSVKRHPFSPKDRANKGELQIIEDTEKNVRKLKMEGLDDSLSSEATHLIIKMLKDYKPSRPTAGQALNHPLFWSKQKKIDFLIAVGNQPEFESPRFKRRPPLSEVEIVLEEKVNTVIKHVQWIDRTFTCMAKIFTEMNSAMQKRYDTQSVVDLVRFIRNAYAHVSQDTRSTPIREQLLQDFVVLDYFPSLLIEVYDAVTTHGWDERREEIKYVINK